MVYKILATPICKEISKKYAKALELYEKAGGLEWYQNAGNYVRENHEEWLKTMMETEEKDMWKVRIETRISIHPSNKSLWKFYINFLKENNNYTVSLNDVLNFIPLTKKNIL